MQPVRDASDLAPAMAAIITAANRGEISPGEGVGYARLVDVLLKAIDTYDFERRLQNLKKTRCGGVLSFALSVTRRGWRR